MGGINDKGDTSHGVPIMPAELGPTPCQGSALALLLEGLSNESTARQLGLTEGIVKEYILAILQWLGVHTHVQIVSRMERFHLTDAA